ncbi:dihydroorotase [Tellurirhabdus rosea]|uniref:dihydroorotase n=1 Tax=Tellurirhabdus rosea TaxID=2674997 RepID=UPI00224F92F5|nr:dihydroorotase [Tellurirhabdus rosea]
MKILIQAARIIDSQSPLNGRVRDILIENGLIRQMGEGLEADDTTTVLTAPNLCVSPGWVDMRVSAKDPGYEHKEDLSTVCRAAARGGFTDIAVLPNTKPALDSKDTLGYVRQATTGQPVSVHAIGAVTRKTEGTDFADMIDLHHAGAVAFSDGEHPLTNPDLLVKTLRYLRPFNGLLMNRPEETRLTVYGQMNEGVSSTLLGLRGMPALAEELMIERDLQLLRFALDPQASGQPNGLEPVETFGQKPEDTPVLHFSTLSTARSVELVRQAKAAGLPVSCDVATHQLAFDDSALMGFDTNLKVNPPFRLPTDVAALREGLADGTIDALVSDHNPQEEESKNLEFDQAEFGIIGLETAFSVARSHTEMPLDGLIDKLTRQPRRILRLPSLTIAENQPATLTLFDPDREWTFAKSVSKAKNTPFLGQKLTGKALWIVNRGAVEHVES